MILFLPSFFFAHTYNFMMTEDSRAFGTPPPHTFDWHRRRRETADSSHYFYFPSTHDTYTFGWRPKFTFFIPLFRSLFSLSSLSSRAFFVACQSFFVLLRNCDWQLLLLLAPSALDPFTFPPFFLLAAKMLSLFRAAAKDPSFANQQTSRPRDPTGAIKNNCKPPVPNRPIELAACVLF